MDAGHLHILLGKKFILSFERNFTVFHGWGKDVILIVTMIIYRALIVKIQITGLQGVYVLILTTSLHQQEKVSQPCVCKVYNMNV